MKHGLLVLVLALSSLALTNCSSNPSAPEGMRAVFNDNKAQSDSCFQKISKKQPDMGAGTVAMKFLIDEDGHSYKTFFLKKSSTLSNKLLNACLKKVVHTWQFPAGKATQVVYEFNFQGDETAPKGDSMKEPEKQSDMDVIDTTPTDDGAGSGDESTPTE